MDIMHLVDRLEQIVTDSRRIPMTASVIVDEDRLFNIIDQMRVSIPEEVKKAGRVVAEKDRVLAQAKEEGGRIRDLAKAEAEELVKRDAITQMAQQKADAILAHAEQDAARMRDDSDVYAANVLTKLEDDLLRSLTVVRNGLRKLHMEDAQPVAVQEPVLEDA